MRTILKILCFIIMVTAEVFYHPLKASILFQDLPDDILRNIGKYFNHREITKYYGQLSTKLHTLSCEDWTWKRTDIKGDKVKSSRELYLFLGATNKNPNLPVEELTISNVSLASSHLQGLAQWMFSPQNSTLKVLSFHGCSLGENMPKEDYEKFAADLGGWLKSTSTLTVLDFTKSKMDFKLLKQISNSLQCNKSLRKVILDEIFEGPFPGSLPRDIHDNLKQNDVLELFSFKNNSVTSSFDDQPLKLLKQISELRPNSLKCLYEGTKARIIL